MNIFEFAKKMESDGEGYYRELAGRVGNEGLRNILNMLADDEVKHIRIVESMARAEKAEMTETTVLDDAKNVFEKMKGRPFDTNIGQVDLYQKARDLERQSVEFYTAKSAEVDSAHHRELFQKIAEEERKHYFLLENIMNFVNRPASWIEDAEFNHLEDY
jgi:rubrerythrin